MFSKRHTGSRFDQIDLALRRVLESPRFCISLKASTNGNSAVVFSKTDNQLAVAGSDRIIRIWNLSRSEEQPVIIESCPGIVRALSFNLKNNRLIAITKDDELVSWTLNRSHSASTLLFVRKVSDSRVTAASFSSDGNRLVTSHEKGFFLVWNLLEPNVAPQKYPFPKGKFEISAITFHPNKNDMLITGDDFGVVKLWYLNQLTSQPRELGRHNSPVSSVAVSPDGFLIASGSELTVKAQSLKSWVFETEGNEDFVLTKGDVRIWKDDKIDSEPIILDEITGTVSSLTFSPSGDSLAFGDVGSGNVSLYSLSGTKIQSMVLPSLEAGVFALCFNKNDKMLAAVNNNDPNVRIWNYSDPEDCRLS